VAYTFGSGRSPLFRQVESEASADRRTRHVRSTILINAKFAHYRGEKKVLAANNNAGAMKILILISLAVAKMEEAYKTLNVYDELYTKSQSICRLN